MQFFFHEVTRFFIYIGSKVKHTDISNTVFYLIVAIHRGATNLSDNRKIFSRLFQRISFSLRNLQIDLFRPRIFVRKFGFFFTKYNKKTWKNANEMPQLFCYALISDGMYFYIRIFFTYIKFLTRLLYLKKKNSLYLYIRLRRVKTRVIISTFVLSVKWRGEGGEGIYRSFDHEHSADTRNLVIARYIFRPAAASSRNEHDRRALIDVQSYTNNIDSSAIIKCAARIMSFCNGCLTAVCH